MRIREYVIVYVAVVVILALIVGACLSGNGGLIGTPTPDPCNCLPGFCAPGC